MTTLVLTNLRIEVDWPEGQQPDHRALNRLLYRLNLTLAKGEGLPTIMNRPSEVEAKVETGDAQN